MIAAQTLKPAACRTDPASASWHFSVAFLALLFLTTLLIPVAAAERLRIGVTLHPYYSWVANIVGDAADLVAIVPGDQNPHSFQPRPDDLLVLKDLDVIVINGLGHDQFIESMLAAAGRDDLPRIQPAEGLPGLNAVDGNTNSHGFISINNAAAQIYNLARALGELDAANTQQYQDNARNYVKRLRWMLTRTMSAIGNLDLNDLRIATVHDGYAYLFRELGLQVMAVIQPRHAMQPSPRQLADTIKRLKAARVEMLFTEMDFPPKIVATIREETGVRLYRLSHISSGAYSADRFETDMGRNYASIHRALMDRTKARRRPQ